MMVWIPTVYKRTVREDVLRPYIVDGGGTREIKSTRRYNVIKMDDRDGDGCSTCDDGFDPDVMCFLCGNFICEKCTNFYIPDPERATLELCFWCLRQYVIRE